jgi:nucleoid DNA-binding protein
MAKESGRTSSKTAKTASKAGGAKPRAKAAEKAPARKRATGPITDPMTKAQLYGTIAESVGLAKSQVAAVFDEMQGIIGRHLGARGAGSFTLSGLFKITRSKKPATKARVGRNPRTGETITIAAKPARTVVKVRALKGLKEML